MNNSFVRHYYLNYFLSSFVCLLEYRREHEGKCLNFYVLAPGLSLKSMLENQTDKPFPSIKWFYEVGQFLSS